MDLHWVRNSGPSEGDVHSRRVWSLSTGRLIDECEIDLVSDKVLNRELPEPDDLRVELVLKSAAKLSEKKGPDVSDIFSQPRICQEARQRGLSPGWSLDLGINDPKTGKPFDLRQVAVQNRVKKLISPRRMK